MRWLKCVGVIGRASYWHVLCELVRPLCGVNIILVPPGRILKRCPPHSVEMFWFPENRVIGVNSHRVFQ